MTYTPITSLTDSDFYMIVCNPFRGPELWTEGTLLSQKDVVRWLVEAQTKPEDVHSILRISLATGTAEDVSEEIAEDACNAHVQAYECRSGELDNLLRRVRDR
jgi:hypothetical protein